MYLTGFADEAAERIDNQIKATLELGWQHIETRNISGTVVHDLSDAEFDQACEKLDAAGIKINCFGSAIANWGKHIDEPFDSSLAGAKRAIPRMQKVGCKLIRVMSFAIFQDREPDDQMEDERFRRLGELQKMFAAAGLTMVHENCMNYGGMGWPYTLKLIENVPGLKLVFDVGNPVGSLDRSKPKPWPRQSSWEFYQHVKEHIAHIHIKDGTWDQGEPEPTWAFPGEGSAEVPRIVKDLLANGYDGGFSIEPHMTVVYHDPASSAPEHVKYANYLEYGRRLANIVREAKDQLSIT